MSSIFSSSSPTRHQPLATGHSSSPSPQPLAARHSAFLAAYTLGIREWTRFIRQPNRVFGAVGQPLIFWLLFGVGLGPSFRAPGNVSGEMTYQQYFFPGSLILIILFTAIFATISIIEDRREGFLQSVLVAPIPRWSMVLGKVLGGTAIAMAEGLLFLLLALTLGITMNIVTFAAIVLLLFIVSVALTSLGVIIAWRMNSTQGFHAIMSVFLMPMWLLSGAFFPPKPWSADMTWGEWLLAWTIHLNPLTYGVAGLRRLLFGGEFPAGTPSLVACWVVTIVFAGLMFAGAWRIAGTRTTGDLL